MIDAQGKVAVLMGGSSSERNVSLMSGGGVLEALQMQGVDAIGFDPAERPLTDLSALGIQRVFIALHGRHGEDGTMQGALELLGVPYTGSGPMASAIAMDKIMTKRVWVADGLPTPAFRVVERGEEQPAGVEQLGFPLMIKAPHEGSTIGVIKVDSVESLAVAMEEAHQFDDALLAEAFIRGRELTVAVLGRGAQARALPLIEIVAPGGNYDYEHKYFSDDTQYLCPAPLPESLSEQIQALAVKAYRSVGCEGWGRVDFMLDDQERPWLLEINTSPGMTSHSLVPMAAKAAGLAYPELCLEILKSAALKCSLPKQGGA